MEFQPHMLAVPFPAQGHIVPMFQLCQDLARSGLLVTFLVPLQKDTLFALTEQTSTNLRFAFFPDEFVQENFQITDIPVEFLSIFSNALEKVVPQVIQDIIDDTTLPRLTRILTDSAIVCLQKTAHEFQLHQASLCTFPATWISVHRGLELLQEKVPFPLKGIDKIIDFIPGLPSIGTKDLPTQIQELVPGRDVELRMRRFQQLENNAWVLINTFHELETAQLEEIGKKTPHFIPVGPLLPLSAFPREADCQAELDMDSLGLRPGFWKEELGCLDWLDEQPANSVVYVSFGSLTRISFKQVQEIYAGLEQSGQPYLWVARSDMVNEAGGLEGLFDQSQRGKFVSWAPQLKVLKHPSVALFFSHCGWNSTMEAVVTETPLLCWPFLYDQPLNCALAVDHWKIGIRMSDTPGSLLKAEEVERAVRGMMMGEQAIKCRENIHSLSVAARNAVSETGASKRNLQAFLDDL